MNGKFVRAGITGLTLLVVGTPACVPTEVPSEQTLAKDQQSFLSDVTLEQVYSLGDESTDNTRFAGIKDIDLDANGSVYVWDSKNARVQVFDTDGQYLRTIGGQEGQGPTTFDPEGHVAVAGNDLIHVSRNRISVWNINGEHLRTVGTDLEDNISRIEGFDDGTFVANYDVRKTDFSEPVAAFDRNIARFSSDGEILNTYATFNMLDEWQRISVSQTGSNRTTIRYFIPNGEPNFAVDTQGNVYVTSGDTFEVSSFTREGEPRWSRTLDRQLISLGEEYKQERIDFSKERLKNNPAFAGFIDSDIILWPQNYPALDAHDAVGRGYPIFSHGNQLFVFPFIPNGKTPETRLVYALSATDGIPIFSGTIPNKRQLQGFQAVNTENFETGAYPDMYESNGTYVFTKQSHPVTGEDAVFKYRLIAPPSSQR